MGVLKNPAIFLFGVVVLGALYVDGFPDGAPVDVCVKPKPNRPYHGKAEAQPLASSPYQITASSGTYQPGSEITVTIRGSSFRGFFLQARDAKTDAWVGTWAQTPNTKAHDECSAITHADPRDKQEATLIWKAPSNSGGQVYFTGSIVKDYSTFWADLVAQNP
ncbi:putative defense protein 3 [Venturia canescens]|uniref:putative defense protein 3 n=1 Tax=Venturia canescens TaxID=32260 RepID=UPI001C9C5380|nr:putative defense protein 3 [Venturia canescens]XP_043271449.1 putative defense protein 3 [Venturia canescens]